MAKTFSSDMDYGFSMNDVFYLPALMHIQPYFLSANIGTVVEKKPLVDTTLKK